MKQTTRLSIAATLVMMALGLTNCKKEQVGSINDSATDVSAQQSYASLTATSEDRIDAIVKDLAQGSYSLSFDKPLPASGITRTAYGADSYLAFADPQDMICSDPIRRIQKYVPIWKIPQFVQPTCPDMTIDPVLASKIQDMLLKADPIQFRGLKGIRLPNASTFLATPKFTSQYANLKLDKIDEITSGLNPQKFILFTDPSKSNGLSTRNAYGYADLNDIVMKPYKKNFKDLVKPILVGCYDPEILKLIREGFQRVSPAAYKNLGVKPIPEAGNIATLSMGF